MDTASNIGIGIVVAAVIGVGIYLAVKKKALTTAPIVTPPLSDLNKKTIDLNNTTRCLNWNLNPKCGGRIWKYTSIPGGPKSQGGAPS